MNNSIHNRGLRIARVSSAALAIALIVPLTVFAAPPKYKPPRTEFGHPDLQGVWNYSSDIPLERTKEFADKVFISRADAEKFRDAKAKQFDQFAAVGVGAHSTSFFDFAAQTENLRSSLVVYPADGRLPKPVDGVPHFNGSDGVFSDAKGTYPVRLVVGGIGKDGPEQRGLFERCLTINSIPFSPAIENNYTQIVQNKDYVILLIEQIHDARIVPLDGRPFVFDKMRSWLGESRGHYEGDTLVIVTKNFTDRAASFNGYGTSYDKVVTERFTRTSATTLKYEATVDDKKTFQDKIVIEFPMVKTDARMFEFACHEGNYDMTTILSGARKQELEALEAKQ